MPIAEFRLPDGRIAQFKVPDGTTPEQAQQMIAPMISGLPKPEEEPGILSQIASLPKEVSKGFIRGLTVDPISGASSLAYTGAQAAGMEGKPFEETAFGKSLGKAQAALAPGQGTISEFGGGVGSMLSFLPGGLLKGGIGLATKLAQTGAVGSEEARQRADQARLEGMDVSAGDRLTAQLGGTAVGFTELAPLERIASPLRAVLRGIPASKADQIAPGLFNSAKRMLATGGVEGLQEGLSNVAQDLIAKGIYNPNLDVGQSALGDAAMGASVGAFAQGAIELLTKGKRTQMYNELKQGEQAKADEERMKGIQDIQEARNKATVNPVGFFTAQDLSPDYVDAVNQSRLEQGKVKLNKFSIEDLVESGAHPEEINQLISERTGFDGSAALTPDQVLAVAQEKNIQVDNKGFADFLRRTTGTEALETMSQPQLHAAFKSLEAAPAFEEPTALQEGSNSVRFTQQDYNSVIGAVKSVMPKEGMITLDQAMNAAAKVKTEEEAKALLKIAADSGDLNAVEKSRYDLVDAEGTVLRSYANRADAERAATQRGLGVQESTSINFAPTAEEVITSEDGTSIRKGTFKQPAGYEIRSDAAVLDVAPTAEEADAKADRMQELREKKAKQLQDQAIKLEEAIAKSNEKLEELKAEGKFESPLFKKAEQDIAKNNQKLQAQIARLNSQSMAFLAPLQVTPRLGRPFKQTGFTVFDQNGNPAATFKTIDEARKQAPTVGKPTVEFQAQADALIKQLRPVMDRLGLSNVRLNIEKAIKTPQGSADGYYLNNLIAIALDSPNPMRTLRHEGIHALKELGAFTPDQWRVLENKAKSEWMSKYDIRNRYKHLSEEEMLEEAISDAFSDFDQTRPPAGLIGALFNKIKLFLESLGNALRGRGFTTAEGLFERVEAGEMRPTAPTQGKQKLSLDLEAQARAQRPIGEFSNITPPKSLVDLYRRVEEADMNASIGGYGGAKAAATKLGRRLNREMEAFAKESLGRDVTDEDISNLYTKLGRLAEPETQGKQKLSIAQPTQQVKKRSMEDLEKAIPLKDRVVSKDPTRMVDGKPFSQANISKTGVGFLPLKKYGEEDAQGMINKFWLDSINESGGQYIKNLVDSLGAKPPTVDFINKALSLPELYRYWYEISGETVANLPLPNEIQKTLLDLISATSLLTKPLPNAQRAIGALAEVLQGKPIETDIISLKPVQDALRNPDLETLKFGNFAGTMKYVSGMTDKAPITTNDRQVAFAFDMQANDFAKNPAMYEVVSRFYNKLRDAQNALLPKKEQPYEAWQMQALTWVEQRGDNTSFNTKTSDDYQQAIQAITKILKEEDIPLIDGKISMVTLLDKRVPKILSQTMERFQNALKGTIESNTLLNTEGAEANTEYANLQDIDKPWSKNLQKEFLRIQRRVFEEMSSKGVLNDFASAIIGRKINISRIDTTSRGTFEGKLSPNMRVPLVGSLSENKPYALNTEEAEVLLAYLGGSLDQAAMAASVFKPSDAKNADTFRVLIENKNVTDDEVAALEKAVGYPLNIFESANGSVVEINVGGYDVMPKLPEVSSAFEDVLGDIPMRVIPTSYESIYITKDKGDYSKSYQEIIDAYATSKFGGSESSGIRRKFDANIDRSVLKIREIVETRNKEFGEFTAEAREKLRKYEAQRLKKQAQELKEQAKQVTGGKASLRAPNTPEFKQWFGKSKIVGRDGKPKVMYHGTARDITEFEPKQANAIFLTDDPTFAEDFTGLSENYMRKELWNESDHKKHIEWITKAAKKAKQNGEISSQRMTEIISDWTQLDSTYGTVPWEIESEIQDLLSDELPSRKNILPVFVKAEDPFDYSNPNHIKRLKEWIDDFDILKKVSRGSWQTIESQKVQTALEQEGFDSFYVLENGRKNLAVYKSNQIKSATGNQGTFDINNPDIRYSLSAPDTPAFKQWFKGSKVVDENGKPLLVYHNTFDDFDEFKSNVEKINRSGNPDGFYFTSTLRDTDFYLKRGSDNYKEGSNVMPVYLNINRPFNYIGDPMFGKTPINEAMVEQFEKELRKENPNLGDNWIRGKVNIFKESKSGSPFPNITFSSEAMTRVFKAGGYDGIRDGSYHWVAFDAPQVKSAIANKGTFDPSNSNIRYSLSIPNTTQFKRWFGDSKAVDNNGKPAVLYHSTYSDFDVPTTNFGSDEYFKFGVHVGTLEAASNRLDMKAAEDYQQTRKVRDTGANIMPVFVKAERPLRLDENRSGRWGVYDIMRSIFEKAEKEGVDGISDEDIDNWYSDHFDIDDWVGLTPDFNDREYDPDKEERFWSDSESYLPGERSALLKAFIQQLGYDSIVYDNKFEGGGDSYLLLDANQVKSAIGNQGTFNPSSPDIRYSLRNNIDPRTVAAIDRTTTVRPEKGFVERIIGAISPDSMAHFRQAYINKYEAIERQSGQIGKTFGSVELIADTSAIAAALQADRAAGIAAESFKRGVPVFRNGFTSVDDMKGQVKGLIPILEPLAAYKDPFAFRAFQFYAATRRGRRLTAEGREKLFTPDEIRRGQALEAQFPAFKQVFDEYQKYNQGLVKYMKDTGVISDAEAKIWTQNWDYIPFYRQMDGETTAGPKVFSSIAGVGKPKALKGSEEALADFMETVVRNSRAAIEAGMKNEAARRVIRDMLRLNQGRLVPAGTSGADIVTMKENGVTKHYQVDDPLLVESLKGLNLPQLPFLEVLAMPSNVLRNLVTKDPGFMIANLARDSMQAWVTSGTNITPLVDTFKQAGKVLAGMSPEAEALAKAGLFGGFDFANDIQSSSRAVEKELRKRSKDFKPQEIAMMPLSKMWELLDKGSTASDVATRAEVYKRVLKETGSEAEAIYQAMEVMNFSRKGNSALIRILSAVVPFLNARIQGLDVLYRSGFGKMATQNREAMQKAFITRSLAIFGLSCMYWVLASDTDEYKTAEPETRDNYWIFGNVRIPIPFEIGTLFKVFPERILEYFFGQDTGADLKESIIRNITSTLAFNPIPQALLPIVENTANYSFFTGKPIVGMGLEGLEPKFQAGASTSILAQEIGAATNSSPAKIDNLIKGYTGTLGTYAAMMLDSVMRGEGDPTKASMKLEQMPVFKRFFSPSEGTGTISAYYDLKNAVETSTRTINFLERTGNTEDLQQYLTGKGGKLQAIKPYIQTLDKDMTMLRDTRKMVMMSQMEPDAKRAVLDNIRSAEVGLTSRIQSVRKMLEN